MLIAYKVQLMGWGCWINLSAGDLPAAWLEKLRQLGEGPGILSLYGRPRGWSVPLGGCSLTSWSSSLKLILL